ncbi:MAG: AAA family ATPase, partial [Oscillospiraceae bacterium]
MNSKANDILYEVKKAIVGKDDVAAKVLTAIIAGGNVLIEDVPGVGKTTLAVAFGKALGL